MFPFEEKYDIIISALSIHHLDAAHKKTLYQKIFSLLADGGEFLNADQIISPDADLQKRYEEVWLSIVKSGGLTDAEMARMRQSMALDTPQAVEEQLNWFKNAGFAVADCVYKYMNFAVLYGYKEDAPDAI
jgi:tRNA (cmo5U34)-methyltransferase